MTPAQKSLEKARQERPDDFYPNGILKPYHIRHPRGPHRGHMKGIKHATSRATTISKHERLMLSMLRGPGTPSLTKLARDGRARGCLMSLIKLTNEKPSIAMTRLGLTSDEQARVGIEGKLKFMENNGFGATMTLEGLNEFTPEGFNGKLVNCPEVESLTPAEVSSRSVADWALNVVTTKPMTTLDMIELMSKVADELEAEELL